MVILVRLFCLSVFLCSHMSSVVDLCPDQGIRTPTGQIAMKFVLDIWVLRMSNNGFVVVTTIYMRLKVPHEHKKYHILFDIFPRNYLGMNAFHDISQNFFLYHH